MNASTDIRQKIMKGQKHFDIALVRRLLEEHDALRKVNATLRQAETATVDYIGGHIVETDNGAELCEPVPVVTIKRKG
jgi:hypothetical protein